MWIPSCKEKHNLQNIVDGIDLDQPSILLENALYYISGFVVEKMVSLLCCQTCIELLTLDEEDVKSFKNEIPKYAHLLCKKQKGGLCFPSKPVFKIVKATEKVFREIVMCKSQVNPINFEQNIELRIEMAVVSYLGPLPFDQPKAEQHFREHILVIEQDHISALTRNVIRTYLNMRKKSYAKDILDMWPKEINPLQDTISQRQSFFKISKLYAFLTQKYFSIKAINMLFLFYCLQCNIYQ